MLSDETKMHESRKAELDALFNSDDERSNPSHACFYHKPCESDLIWYGKQIRYAARNYRAFCNKNQLIGIEPKKPWAWYADESIHKSLINWLKSLNNACFEALLFNSKSSLGNISPIFEIYAPSIRSSIPNYKPGLAFDITTEKV